MHTIAGTPYFISPDVLNGDYGQECDIWSLGGVFYMMLTGHYPFDGRSRPEVFSKIKTGSYIPPRNVSEECKNLLSKMLEVDRKKRISAADALKHPWFHKILNMKDDEVPVIGKDVMDRLKEFRGTSKLKRAALNVFVKIFFHNRFLGIYRFQPQSLCEPKH